MFCSMLRPFQQQCSAQPQYSCRVRLVTAWLGRYLEDQYVSIEYSGMAHVSTMAATMTKSNSYTTELSCRRIISIGARNTGNMPYSGHTCPSIRRDGQHLRHEFLNKVQRYCSLGTDDGQLNYSKRTFEHLLWFLCAPVRPCLSLKIGVQCCESPCSGLYRERCGLPRWVVHVPTVTDLDERLKAWMDQVLDASSTGHAIRSRGCAMTFEWHYRRSWMRDAMGVADKRRYSGSITRKKVQLPDRGKQQQCLQVRHDSWHCGHRVTGSRNVSILHGNIHDPNSLFSAPRANFEI